MFEKRRATVECPISRDDRHWIERRWAWLKSEFGLERLRALEVVLPRAEFFPDRFTSSPDDVRGLLDRVCGYLGIDSSTIELSLYEDRNPVFEDKWGKKTAGLYEEESGRFRVWIEITNLADPLALVATIVHELGHVLLLGHGRITTESDDHEPLTDLLTVFLGMGIFTANSTIREQYLRAGAYTEYRMARQGYLSMPMYGYAFALFARDRNEQNPSWANELRADVRAAFHQATRFLEEHEDAEHVIHAESEVIGGVTGRVAAAEKEDDDEEEPADDQAAAEKLLKRYARGERRFPRADLHDACLAGADLSGCNFTEADFTHADLCEANLSESRLEDADFLCASLQRADMRAANLRGADFTGADLSHADLSGADLRGADFSRVLLYRTNLTRTRRDRTTLFEGQDLSLAICDVDLDSEIHQGIMASRQFAERFDFVIRVAGWLVAIWLGMLFGALGGNLVGAVAASIFEHRRVQEYCFYAGIVVGACLVIWLLVKQTIKRRPDKELEDREMQ